MEALLATLEATALADYLRGARWGYAAVNTTHIFGIALLVGAILPLDLRLLGLWPGVPRAPLVGVLSPVAATGLAIAVCAGILLFSIRAREYADLDVFRLKLAFITIGALSALAVHWRFGLRLERTEGERLIGPAAVSTTCWLGALICGRLIAFVID